MLRFEILRNGESICELSSGKRSGQRQVPLCYFKLLTMHADVQHIPEFRETLELFGLLAATEIRDGDAIEVKISRLIPAVDHPRDVEEPPCSFCDKTKDEVKKLLAAPGASICNECVERFVPEANQIRNTEEQEPSCSFCNKTQREVKKLFWGADVSICNDCVELCVDILENERQRDGTTH